jgi:hypothetical protein
MLNIKKMKNISFLNDDKIKLKIGQSYIIIDALYLMDIKEKLSKIDTIRLIDCIREIIFPYTDIPFAEYKSNLSSFTLNDLKKVDYEEVDISNRSFLCTDTGILIFVNENILLKFIELFDYSELVNSLIDIINIEYWDKLTNQFDEMDLGLMMSQSEDENEILNGGGTYKVK